MAIDHACLEASLRAAFPDATIELTDTVGDQDHWHVHILSGSFAGKTRLAQHRMVYQALGDSVGGQIHALSLKTGAPK